MDLKIGFKNESSNRTISDQLYTGRCQWRTTCYKSIQMENIES